MNKIMLVFGGVLLLLGALFVVSFKLLGAWGILAAVGVSLLFVKLLVRSIKNKLINAGKALFEAKSRVLRGASVTVHDLKPAGETNIYYLDVTIKPQADACSPFGAWDSSELALVSFDTPKRSFDEPDDSAEDAPGCEILEVNAVDAGEDENEGDTKYNGEQRLKLRVEVPENLKRLKFQYYFEDFGDVTLP